MAFGGVYSPRTLLSVNIDHIATLRQARGGSEPDLIEAVVICKKCGCNGITVHLREDRRHVQDRDVFAIREALHEKFNLEMALSDEIIDIALKVKPDQITIVPEKREELTTEGGLDVRKNMSRIKDTVKLFHDQNIPVSLFIEPDMEAIDLSKECEADLIEIHTGAYANAVEKTAIDREIDRIYKAEIYAVKAGLKVGAGHGLSYRNLEPLVNSQELMEVNIGHSIIARSVFVGLYRAVEEVMEILD